MHIEEKAFIDASPDARFHRYSREWMNPSMEERQKSYLPRLSNLLDEEDEEKSATRTRERLEIVSLLYCPDSHNHDF